MRIALMSDIHGYKPSIPDCDMLLVAGDLTSRGTIPQVQNFLDWFGALRVKYKVFIAGNHDFLFEDAEALVRAMVRDSGCTYLNASGVEIEGLKLWGSPWTPWFYDWAFNFPEADLPRGDRARAHWAQIPEGTDILLTHGPPRGILDATARGELVGCPGLMERVELVRPKLHVFGHIHEAYGKKVQAWEDGRKTTFVNAAVCTLQYKPINPVQLVDL